MTKADIIESVYERVGFSKKESADLVELVFDTVKETLERGDKVIVTIINEDDYDHGISLDAFGVSQRMPANGTITVEFVATQEGDFPFYCSVPCGEGEVAGEKRGHFDMVGKLHVRSIISATE